MSQPTQEMYNVRSTANLPNRLEAIRFADDFNQLNSDVEWPPNLQSISLGQWFNQPISEVKWPPSLHTLIFGLMFNQSISEVKWPPNLKTLVLGYKFDQPIFDVKWPPSLQTLSFGYEFNQPISEVKWPLNLQTLTFEHEFNQSISEVEWSPNLHTLSFGYEFNQPISGVKWPPNLHTLSFGYDFNQPISEVNWPPNLLTLTFDGDFNQPVSGVNWPPSLQTLSLGGSFNQSISGVKWSPSLQTLSFGYWFNQPISEIKWPLNLQTLTFGGSFNQSISRTKWPSKIEVYWKHYDYDDGGELVSKLIYPTPQLLRQREQLTKILNKKNRPKTLSLPKPDQWTKWQQLCYKSKSQLTDQDRQQLKTYAKVANIANFENLNATQLCVALAQHLVPYLQRIKNQPPIACQNDSTLEGDDFSDIPQEFIIQDDSGYCFTKSELSKLDKHPYTNQSWDQVKVKGQPILTYADQIHPQLGELHQMFPSQERTLSVESLRTHELTDLINHSETNPESTKYLHPNDLQKYDTKPHDRQRILSEVIASHLFPNFVKIGGNSYLDWINNLLTYIIGVPMNNRETIKYLIVELLKPPPEGSP